MAQPWRDAQSFQDTADPAPTDAFERLALVREYGGGTVVDRRGWQALNQYADQGRQVPKDLPPKTRRQ
eukprot:14387858-Alexandrium_andersonii.AAC.1